MVACYACYVRVYKFFLFQSLVLITILPFFNLFSIVIERIALQFFENGEPAIEAGEYNICNSIVFIVRSFYDLIFFFV